MKHQMKYLVLAGTVAALAGCGGGGGTTLSTGDDFNSLLAKAEAMGDDTGVISNGAIVGTPLADVPADGTGTYKGYVEGYANDGRLMGDLTLEVALTKTTISGSATNFQHEDGTAYTTVDPMTMVSTDIVDAGGVQQFSGNLSGTLANGGTDYETVINLTGNFYDGDNGANTIAGTTTTTIDGNLQVVPPGLFIATQ